MNEIDNAREAGRYTAIRIDDTADWRLIGMISATGMRAWLKHTDPMRQVEKIFESEWPAEEESLLQHIEDAVYDHPQVLDDFSADLVIMAPKSIWVPTHLVADDEEEAIRLYNQVYTAEPADIMQEAVGDATCLYSLVPGLNAFLQRTFSGARIHSHQAVLMQRFRERSSDMPRVYLDIREEEVDFLAFDRKDLIVAATHRWHAADDIKYHLFNILNVFGLDPKNVQVSLSGPGPLKTELVQDLRKDIAYVMMTMMPTVGAKTDMPPACALLLRK